MLGKHSILFCILLGQFIVQGIKIKVLDAEVETADPEYLTVDIKVRQENDESVVDVNADVIKDLDNDLFLQIHLQVKAEKELLTVYKSEVVDRCHFVENKDKYDIFKEFFHEMHKYGNMLNPCPLKKGHYYLKGFKLQPTEMISKALVAGEYVAHIIFLKKIDGNMKTLYSVRYHCNIDT